MRVLIMLDLSTADAALPRMRAFSERWGSGRFHRPRVFLDT